VGVRDSESRILPVIRGSGGPVCQLWREAESVWVMIDGGTRENIQE